MLNSILLAALVAILSPSVAHAYIDPGIGSVIVQVILGGIGGLIVFGKLYWKRLKEFFGAKSEDEEQKNLEGQSADRVEDHKHASGE